MYQYVPPMKELHRLLDQALSRDPRTALIAAHMLEEDLHWVLERAVVIARNDGWNWARIGRLLGRSRQGLRQQFDAVAPRRLPSAAANPMSPDELMARAIVDEVWRRRAGEPPRPFSSGPLGALDDDPVAW